MINVEKLNQILECYKAYFPQKWSEERYKWEAIKQFQDNWVIDAPDFLEMLNKSLSKTANLLTSLYYYPQRMLLQFAKEDPEVTREALRSLFDENKDLAERIKGFQAFAEDRKKNHNNDGWGNHYQNTNAITTYLWLMYPDKYYIYKYSEYRKTADELDDNYQPKKKGEIEDVINGFKMYDEICSYLQHDNELRQMLNNVLTDDCYPDKALKTMTIDLGFYISRYYSIDNNNSEWYPSIDEYTPELSKDKWLELLKNGNIIGPIWGGVLAAFYSVGGAATCTQIAKKYNSTASSISGTCTNLAKRIHKETQCPLYIEKDGQKRYWSILFQGKYADSKTEGVFLWKLRPELYDALTEFDIMRFQWETENVNVWLLTYNPSRWNWDDYDEAIISTNKGKGYLSRWNCANHHAKVGDRVFLAKLGDSSTPKGIIATGYIVSDFWKGDHFDDSKDKKIEYITVLFTTILDYRTDEIITIEELCDKFPEQKWNPQGSGIEIKNDAAHWLLDNWNNKPSSNSTVIQTDELSVSNSEFLKYFAPLIQALKELGGSAARKEAHEKVIELMGITDEELSITYPKTGTSRVINQIDFARNDLAHEGIISNGTKGIWALTELGMNIEMTMELAGLIHMKWVKINTAKRKGEQIPVIDLSENYKKKTEDKYTKEDFLKEVFITESEYDKLRTLVLRKKNLILQGAPGVGKTFSAKRLAYSIIGEKNESRICMVQFHQNYSYEDFIMGYRPNDNGGFELQSGVFYNFCLRCSENPDKPYFLIIDEINRGNLSKIFGELLMLIETDKRGEKYKINLVYGRTPFYIPENLYIIGMMNTADRSLAMIDYALRRRFCFYTMNPAFESSDTNGFSYYISKVTKSGLYTKAIKAIINLNNTIREEFGNGFEIGHSYFINEKPDEIDDVWVNNIIEYEILPLIKEYWFDNDDTYNEVKNKLYLDIGENNDD